MQLSQSYWDQYCRLFIRLVSAQSLTLSAGCTAKATAVEPFAYQWYDYAYNPISGADQAKFTIPDLGAAWSGYNVTVTSCGSELYGYLNQQY